MNKFTCLMIVGAVLSISAPALAESRAVNISVGSIGGPLDNAALRTVRQVIGFAVGTGTNGTNKSYKLYEVRISSFNQ